MQRNAWFTSVIFFCSVTSLFLFGFVRLIGIDGHTNFHLLIYWLEPYNLPKATYPNPWPQAGVFKFRKNSIGSPDENE
jgi:hypothetical protein